MTAALVLLGATAVLCVGGLIGSSLTTQAMEQVGRKQSAERRRLNAEWRALESARTTGSACAGCRGRPGSNWIVLIDRDDEDGE